MNNDKRLIPFIGGLAIGGLGGAALNKNNYMPYYQYPVYQYPYYTYYPYQQTYYPNFNQQNMMTYPNLYQNNVSSAKIMGDVPSVVSYNKDERSYYDISYVPPYR